MNLANFVDFTPENSNDAGDLRHGFDRGRLGDQSTSLRIGGEHAQVDEDHIYAKS